MKSKTDEITEKAFYHAMNFFKHNDRGVDNQRVCIQQLMEFTGFDFDTCLKIQNPVLSLYMAYDTMSIGQSVIESNIQMVTQTIRNHLLNTQINYSQKTFDQKSSNSILSCKDIIEKTTNPPHGNVLSDVRIIDISKSNVKNEDIGVLVQYLQYQGLNLNKFDASNNLLGYGAVENLFYTFSLSRSNTALYNIKYMNLSNNYIGDDGAKYISSHLSAGLHPNLRYLDVSENKITNDGQGMFVTAMKNPVVKDFIVIVELFQKLKEQVKFMFGSKEEKITIYKSLIAKGKEKGTYDEAMVVDKSWWGQIKKTPYIAVDVAIGFSKCHFVPEDMATGHAQDKLVAKVPMMFRGLVKYGAKLADLQGIVTCYLRVNDDVWTSETGMSIIKHDLCLMGESEFCGE
jgi:hypothetical protein